jgi:hypothetical protein
MHGTVSTLYVLSLLYNLSVNKTTSNNIITIRSLSDEYFRRPPKFLLLCNRVRSYKLIIAYHVYYDYYKIDRNKQSKIAVHETDILNSHFTEHLYRQSRLTAVEQITFHDTKIKHFTFHVNKY